MKKVIIVLLILVVGITILSNLDSHHYENKYFAPNNSFSIELPIKYTELESLYENYLPLVSPDEQMYILIERIPQETFVQKPLEAFLISWHPADEITELMNNGEVTDLERIQFKKIPEAKTLEIYYEEDSSVLKCCIIYARAHSSFYAITIMGPQEEYGKDIDVLKTAIANTFTEINNP